MTSVLYVDVVSIVPGIALCNHHGVQKIFFSVNFVSPSQPLIPAMTNELINLHK